MPNIVEQVTLNFTDLTGSKTGCTTLGSNKFWKGWVEDLGGGKANFECRWGPTGEAGSDKGSVRGTSLDAAVTQLRKKVREKEAKGYTRLETRSDAEEMAKAAAKGITPAPVVTPKVVPSAFHPETSRLLKIIYGETSRVVCSGLSAQAGATADNPIGNLSDRQLDIGGSILDEIATLLERNFGSENPNNQEQVLPLDSRGLPRTEIIDLTDRFMSNVPREIARDQRGRGNLHRLVISSYARLNEQRKFLQLLRDVALTKDAFQAAGAATTTSGKEDAWYAGLNCDIEPCIPGDADFTRVANIFNTAQSQKNANWWRGGRSIARVVRVFKFTRKGTNPTFDAYAQRVLAKPGATGKIMAWHGTRTENLLGIGKSGLLMPENLPRGVHISGKAFGKGVYHAPVTTNLPMVHGYRTDGTNGALKSLNYTSLQGAYYGTSNTSRQGFMFLQDVALGLGEVRTTPCWDKHRPDGWPQRDFIYATAGGSSSLSHDEVVTFDQNAQIFRYLIEIEVL